MQWIRADFTNQMLSLKSSFQELRANNSFIIEIVYFKYRVSVQFYLKDENNFNSDNMPYKKYAFFFPFGVYLTTMKQKKWTRYQKLLCPAL